MNSLNCVWVTGTSGSVAFQRFNFFACALEIASLLADALSNRVIRQGSVFKMVSRTGNCQRIAKPFDVEFIELYEMLCKSIKSVEQMDNLVNKPETLLRSFCLRIIKNTHSDRIKQFDAKKHAYSSSWRDGFRAIRNTCLRFRQDSMTKFAEALPRLNPLNIQAKAAPTLSALYPRIVPFVKRRSLISVSE